MCKLFADTGSDAYVRTLLNKHELLHLCKRLTTTAQGILDDEGCATVEYPTLRLVTTLVQEFPVHDGNTWTLTETHDGWEAWRDNALIFVAYVDYSDAHIEAMFPGPSDHGMFR